ncbi:MAG: FKBP-type peptidyl-prolyl cis-trans isomerase [Anaerolineae bacterium]|nr:FKBP-type peptidyl-prolyl cis-trans isomerase [Anaerolineae bacterium]
MSQKQTARDPRNIIIGIAVLAAIVMLAAVLLNAQNQNNTAANADCTEYDPDIAEVVTTASGLQYQVLRACEGAHPSASDTVTVHYRGTLTNGTEFDSSYARNQPASFPLNGVIPGWTEGVQLMTVGSKYRFTIPPQLAYGERGNGPVPPNATLIFDVELLGIN